jgi:hypothetical protein
VPVPAEKSERAKAIAVARVLLGHTEDAGWSVLWPAIQQDQEFGTELITSIAHIADRGAATLAQRLTEDQVADLYIWLAGQYPHAEDPNIEGMHTVGPRESIAHWRDGLLNHLKLRGTKAACEAIRRISNEMPDLGWLKMVLLEARTNTRRQTWTPPQPADVIAHISGQQSQLKQIGLARAAELPHQVRLYIEDMDSFNKVKDVESTAVSHLLREGGYLDISEELIQMALEEIINEPFHKKDWGGEYNDLYSANLYINGVRTSSAFLLKGNGLKKRVMEIKDCGQNGDQLIRLVESPADLFIVQFVGNISESVIKDIEGKVNELRSRGRVAYYCIINGQDTARLLYAYGKLS